jgi:glutamate dehydrogenase
MGRVPEAWATSVETNVATGAQGSGPVEADHLRRFLAGLPPGYAEVTSPAVAALDWAATYALVQPSARTDPVRMLLLPSSAGAPGDFRLRRCALARAELSSVLRVLESFGLVAEEAVPWRIELGEAGGEAYIDDVGLRVVTPVRPSGFRLAEDGPRLLESITQAIEDGPALSALNPLVVGAGLSWAEVNLLRSYCAYRQAVGGPRSAAQAALMTEALVEFPDLAAAAVRLFRARFIDADGQPPGEPSSERAAGDEVDRALAKVPDRSRDEVLRELVALVDATTRTNWGTTSDAVAVKLASAQVPFLPQPRPWAEVLVWSPRFFGVHLRFGPVARGGIRWSDRRSDLRPEVLGLARAQVKKNALIVPTGAKGGFVLDDDWAGEGERDDRGRAAYRAFVSALLDVTDNIVDGRTVPPQGLRCRDGRDPYLVVAPDKGTAAFSDLANEVSAQRGYWLGDAFASGGSKGYDHKALAITARGAWLAVLRHFRALGMDAQKDPLRVVGVGDMSGDVFGNGMLQSRSIALVAAFDHRHVFVDPAPVPEVSFAERQRLSRQSGSSWLDYDLAAASTGAAVYSRQAKQVELSAEVAQALGVGQRRLTPPELVRAVLLAPADLIFFGGIGTFVKAADEDDAAVDDRANDEVRVDARQLRARVVVEGANLAMTQRARSAYARRGGRVNTDFVDNSAGVAMSDREVNLKILLALAVADGRLDMAERDRLLGRVAATVAEAVLAQVERSLVALDEAAAASPADLPAYTALVEDLEQAGLLDREGEALPGAEELARRSQAGAGLSRPELAVLVSCARRELARAVESSELPGAPALAPCLLRYFPDEMSGPLADLVAEHPLAPQLVSCELANEVVDRMGAVWAHELAAASNRPLAEVAAAYWAARQVLGTGPIFDEVDNTALSVPSAAEASVRSACQAALDRLVRWYLDQPGPIDVASTIAADEPIATALGASGVGLGSAAPELVARADELVPQGPPAARADELVAQGAPVALAAATARIAAASGAGEVAAAVRASGRPLEEVVAVGEAVGQALFAPGLSRAIHRRPAADQWERRLLTALADDLVRARAGAVVEALAAAPSTGTAALVEAWRQRRAAGLARLSVVAGALDGAPEPGLALLSLAVRTATEVLRASE